jgi:hypothetical protein
MSTGKFAAFSRVKSTGKAGGKKSRSRAAGAAKEDWKKPALKEVPTETSTGPK